MSKTSVSPHWQMKAALASSLTIGLLLAGAPRVAAEEVVTSDTEASLDQLSPKTEVSQAATPPSDSSSLSEEPAPSPASSESDQTSQASAESNQASANPAPAQEVPDTPQKQGGEVKPKEVKFQNWQELLDWQPGARQDDEINRASVPLASRYQGHVVNPTANPDAKVQALSNMNAKAEDHASVGGEEFKTYAFDHWQYLDSMVFWDGLVPSPDVIDAGHRNGVPVYGTLFFNWSTSRADRKRFLEFLQEDQEGSNTFPLARKLVDVAKYYGYDGYFINQETTGHGLYGKGEKMRQFMLYAKQYAAEQKVNLKFSWYDAFDINGQRNHQNALTEVNRDYMKAEKPQGPVPVDEFFANFNWGKASVDESVNSAKAVNRSQYDVYMGFELQKNSYKTQVPFWDLLDDQGKLRTSLGLFAPDSILGIGTTGESYHREENNFWTGLQQDPTKPKPEDSTWYGLSGYIADKTAILGDQFHTSFNTGHGKRWYIDGKVSKDSEWNYRSVSGILPTWRWWIRSKNGEAGLKGDYDFEDAYNGGNSLQFSGRLGAKNPEEAMLYATKLAVGETTQLKLAHKGGLGSRVRVGLATQANYSADSFHYFDLRPGKDWHQDTLDLSSLKGKTIYAIKFAFESETDQAAYRFNLGQIDLLKTATAPVAPSQVQVVSKQLSSSRQAQAHLAFTPSANADYYEVYQEVAPNKWHLLTGSSNHHIYLAKVSRPQDASGTTQRLKVVAVGKNGLRSEAGYATFDWQMTTSDTTQPQEQAPNIVPGATVTFASGPSDGSEPADAMLNGTITSNADKWCILDPQGHVDIKLSQVRTVRRWVVEHAGAGGESVNDGLMNTRDFDLYYKDMTTGEWLLAKSIRGNRAHVTDVDLDRPITAQEWRLDVVTSHNGTPWGAIRIYNWKMYEQAASKESTNLPMANVAAQSLGNGYVQVGLNKVPAKATVRLYADREATQLLGEVRADQAGDYSFQPVRLAEGSHLLYYKTWEEGKEASNLSAVLVDSTSAHQKIQEVSLEHGLEQTVYHVKDGLNLAGGKLRVRLEGAKEDQLVNLTHPGVTVSGYDATKLGAQDLVVSYLGQTLDQKLRVYVAKADSNDDSKEITHLAITTLPNQHYRPGQDLDLSKGRFQVVYSDQSHHTYTFQDSGVTVSGYDPQRLGEQKVTLHYQDFSVDFSVWVEKEEANFEYLNQKLAEVERLLPHYRYQFATPEEQEALKDSVSKAQDLVKAAQTAEQAQVDAALANLNKALGNLSGQKGHDEARLVLGAVASLGQDWANRLQDPELKDKLSKQVSQARTLMDQDLVSPADFAAAKAQLEESILAAKKVTPTVLHDPGHDVTVAFSGLEPSHITGLKVGKLGPEDLTEAEKQALAGRQALVYDIEGQDAQGQDVDTQYPAKVSLPSPQDQTVEQVLFLPEDGPAQSLPFQVQDGRVVFEGPHFTHYALVFAKAEQSQEPSQPGQSDPVGPEDQTHASQTRPAGDKVLAAASHEDRLPETGESPSGFVLGGLVLSFLGILGLRPKRERE